MEALQWFQALPSAVPLPQLLAPRNILKASYCSLSFFQNTARELKVNHYCTTACNANSKCEADVRDITAYRGSGGKAPPNFNHAARWK